MVMVAEAAEEGLIVIDFARTLADIYDDSATLTYIRDKQLPSEPRELRRVLIRSASYSFHPDGLLYRTMPDGSTKQAPHPTKRSQIVLETHTKCGHYGPVSYTHLTLPTIYSV